MADEGRDVIVTGGAGRIGTALCPALAACGHRVTSFDRHPAPARPGVIERTGDLRDAAAIRALLTPGAALVHLAGSLAEEDWDALEVLNITTTRRLFDLAVQCGVGTIVYASSIHAAGYTPVAARLDAQERYPADSPYGVSKRFGEDLLELLAQRHPIGGYALRIGTCRPAPLTAREQTTWLSPGDAARLVDACLRHRAGGYHRLWALSANSRADIDRGAWDAIGYHPQDDAARANAAPDRAEEVDGAGFGLIGGRFVRPRQPA